MTSSLTFSMPEISPFSHQIQNNLVILCNNTGVQKLNNGKVVDCKIVDSHFYECK